MASHEKQDTSRTKVVTTVLLSGTVELINTENVFSRENVRKTEALSTILRHPYYFDFQ